MAQPIAVAFTNDVIQPYYRREAVEEHRKKHVHDLHMYRQDSALSPSLSGSGGPCKVVVLQVLLQVPAVRTATPCTNDGLGVAV